MVYYRERIQVKISQGQKLIWQNLEILHTGSFHCLLLAECCQPEQFIWALVSSDFTEPPSHGHDSLIAHMVDLGLQVN